MGRSSFVVVAALAVVGTMVSSLVAQPAPVSGERIDIIRPPMPGEDRSPSVPHQPDDGRPLVQIAVLLDTSNSMDGLINQARTQLWTIVNEIGQARRNGRVPRLQVALLEYGNDRLAAGEGFIRTVLPFTDNLDDVSEKLFALSTNGGSEFCGHVIQQATTTLAWSKDVDAYKTIFIAGNEPFGQGNVDYKLSCSKAAGEGIVINTIHCGDRGQGIEGSWADGAKIGGGYFSNINQDRQIRVIRCPQDDRIEKLSVEINATYVPFGERGKDAQLLQSRQDDNAKANAAAGSSVQRAAAKAGYNYQNSSWDLVDAVQQDKLDLNEVPEAQLPEEMKKMNASERAAHIDAQAKQRAAIRAEIEKLMAERGKFLAQRATTQPASEQTLDAAVVEAVREQLKARNYEMNAESTPK